VALSCEEGTLHIQEDIVFAEFEALGGGRHAIAITQLHRRSLPIIRYRLNDIVTFTSTPCPCGSAFRGLQSVEGRCDQILTFGEVTLFPGTVRHALMQLQGLDDYRIQQSGENELTIYYNAATCLNQEFRALFARLNCTPELVIYKGVPPRAPQDKHMRIFGLNEKELN